MNMNDAAPASVLAFITTVHLGLAVLRAHRTPDRWTAMFVSFISILLSGSPWLLSTPVGIAAGFVVHLGWFIACEWLLPTAAPAAPASSKPAAARPASGVAQMARKPPAPAPRPPAPKAASSPAARPNPFVQTPIVAVFDETPDIRTFRMVRPEGFEFKAGQFLTVRFRADGREHVRCYSISSPPDSRGHLEITVKRLGMVSGALHASLRPGSMLAVRAPAGAFTYPVDEDRPIVLIAGGVGITPLMSMLRHAIETEPTRPVTLFYSVRRVEDVAFRDEISMLNKRHAHFRAFVAVSDGEAPGAYFPGRLNEALITAMMPDIEHAICMLCGPQPMLDAMTALLAQLRVPKSQVRFEIFQAAVAASAGAAKPAPPPEPVPEDRAGYEVTFNRSGKTAVASGDQTMLELAEGCGADIPSLCRAGVCGTCRTKVISGNVHCTSQTLDDQDRADGYVLACVSQVLGDCAVDA